MHDRAAASGISLGICRDLRCTHITERIAGDASYSEGCQDEAYAGDECEEGDYGGENLLVYLLRKKRSGGDAGDKRGEHSGVYGEACGSDHVQVDHERNLYPVDDKEEPCARPHEKVFGKSHREQICGNYRAGRVGEHSCYAAQKTHECRKNSASGHRFPPEFLLLALEKQDREDYGADERIHIRVGYVFEGVPSRQDTGDGPRERSEKGFAVAVFPPDCQSHDVSGDQHRENKPGGFLAGNYKCDNRDGKNGNSRYAAFGQTLYKR